MPKTKLELSKQEALKAYDLRFQTAAAQANFASLNQQLNDYIEGLCNKHNVAIETHDLDLSVGRFVKKEENGKPS
jgi:hypothetical protein